MTEIVRNKSLRYLNTFGIDVKSSHYAEFRNIEELRKIFEYQEENNLNWYPLSGGSNTLFTRDYKGIIIHPLCSDITTRTENEFIYVKADAGTLWDNLVFFSIEHNLWGIENLYGIPGYVGSSPIQNIGAYGVEAKDCIYSVDFYDKKKNGIVTLLANDCNFGYRDSIFKKELKGKGIIISVTYRLSIKENPRLDYGDLKNEVENKGKITIKNIADSVISIRNSKLPDPNVLGNSGSFFKNPLLNIQEAVKLKNKYPEVPLYPHGDKVKVAAGWLIEKAGWKGYRKGDCGVHDRQALVLVNHGNSSGEEIKKLAEEIISDINTKFNINIETEVNIL